MSTANTCANCGKGEENSGDVKSCAACKMVKYCNRECQIAHRPQHKKECKKRAAELRDEKLFKEPPPPEECPICMLPPPANRTGMTGMTFHSCCGKNLCDGCVHTIEESGEKDICPFCRTPPSKSEEESVKRIKKLMEKGNADAFHMLAGFYRDGTLGMPQHLAKANELYLKAGELGHAGAYFNLGRSYQYGRGAEINIKKANHFYELAAMNGNLKARNNLGINEYEAGNYQRAFKHLLIGAKSGDDRSLDGVKKGYKGGYITKEEYANTLREYQKSQDETKSDARDKAQAFYEMHG